MELMKIQILAIGLLILGAYAGGVITKKLNIGEIVGQILGGILVGPHFWILIHDKIAVNDYYKSTNFFQNVEEVYRSGFASYSKVISESYFFVFFFLALLVFSLGEELHFDRLKKLGVKPPIICLIQAVFTWLGLTLAFWKMFHFPLVNSLVIGSIGIATAPAMTFILMGRLKIGGKLKNLLANVLVLDDIIEVVFFSIFLGVATMTIGGGTISIGHLFFEVSRELILSSLLGVGIFIILKLFIRPKNVREEEGLEVESFYGPTPSTELFFIIMGFVSMGTAAALQLNLPFLMTAVVAGILVSNYHYHAIFQSLQLSNLMPALNIFFFALIGANVKIETFSKETFIYVIGYVVVRTITKVVGTWLGCRITGQEKEITSYLPKLMLPQAGLAAVETMLVAAVLKGHGGEVIFNTIIPALIVFEVGGAWFSEKLLVRWKEMTESSQKSESPKTVEQFSIGDIVVGEVVEIEAVDKNTAIEKLVKTLHERGVVKHTHEVFHSIMAREKLASTALGKGVAIPHCRTDEVEKTISICGILKTTVDWESPDGKTVDVIFLVVTPKEKPQEYLKAVKVIITTIKTFDLEGGINQELLKNTLSS